jgi:oligoendopeptidase F
LNLLSPYLSNPAAFQKGDTMHPFTAVTLSIIGISLSASSSAFAQQGDRSKIPDTYKWDLTHIYPSDGAWRQAKEKIVAEIPRIEQFKGMLGKSAQQLFGCLDRASQVSKELTRLGSYASMISDQDTRESKYLAMQQEIRQVYSDFAAKAAFVEPEILSIDRKTVDQFLGQEKKLEVYRHYLDDILRRQAHTGTAGEEKIIADASLMSDAAESIY